MDAALELANKLTYISPLTLNAAKKLANIQLNTDLQTAIELEKQTITVLYGTKDRFEGTSAFIEKRKPIWSGK
jgi:enoyl-CoA hydratase/carnithine racemase